MLKVWILKLINFLYIGEDTVEDASEDIIDALKDEIGKLLDRVQNMLFKLIVTLAAGIYKLVSVAYQIFISLVHVNIFSNSEYSSFSNKIYAILGVVMLFVLAYNVITYIIDPDKNKNGQSVEGLLKKLISSFIIIAICPFIFSLMVRVQTAVIDGGFFDKFFGDTQIDVDNFDASVSPGSYMEFETFGTFIYSETGKSDSDVSIDYDVSEDEDPLLYSLKSDVKNITCDNLNGKALDCKGDGGCTLEEIKITAMLCDTYKPYYYITPKMVSDDVTFNFLASVVAGAFLTYVLVFYAFDVAVRLFKLFFFELIAPICVACRVVPSKEGVFKTWFDSTKDTYLSVMIKIFVLRLEVWMLKNFVATDLFAQVENLDVSGIVKVFTKAFIIVGLVLFLKQAPDLINKIFGIEDAKIGKIGDKFKEAFGKTPRALATAGAAALGTSLANGRSKLTALKKYGKDYINGRKGTDGQGLSGDEKKQLRNDLHDKYKQEAGAFGMVKGGMSAGMRALYKASSLPKKVDTFKDIMADANASRAETRGAEMEKQKKNELKRKGEELSQSIAAAEIKRDLAKVRQAELENQLATCDQQLNKEPYKSLMEQRNKLDLEIKDADAKLAKDQEQLNKVNEELTSKKDALTTSKNKDAELAAKKDALLSTRKQLLKDGKDTSLVDAQIKDLTNQQVANLKQTEQLEFDQKKLADQKVSIEAQISTDSNAKVEAQAKLTKLKSEKATEFTEIETIKDRKTTITNEINTVKNEIETHETSIASDNEAVKKIAEDKQALKQEQYQNITKLLWGEDISKQVDQLKQFYDREFEMAEKLINKFGSAMRIQAGTKDADGFNEIMKALKKQTYFEENKAANTAFAEYIESKDISTLKSTAASLDLVRNIDELHDLLGQGLCDAMGANEDNFKTIANQAAKSISGPLMKTAKAQLSDCLKGVNGAPAILNANSVKAVLGDEAGRAFVRSTEDTLEYMGRTHLENIFDKLKTHPEKQDYHGEPIVDSATLKKYMDQLDEHVKIMANKAASDDLAKKAIEAAGGKSSEGKKS